MSVARNYHYSIVRTTKLAVFLKNSPPVGINIQSICMLKMRIGGVLAIFADTAQLTLRRLLAATLKLSDQDSLRAIRLNIAAHAQSA
jgi:hypothetical protein